MRGEEREPRNPHGTTPFQRRARKEERREWATNTIKALPPAHGQPAHGQAATDAHEDQESDGEDW